MPFPPKCHRGTLEWHFGQVGLLASVTQKKTEVSVFSAKVCESVRIFSEKSEFSVFIQSFSVFIQSFSVFIQSFLSFLIFF